MKHNRYSPSSAHIWRHCLPSKAWLDPTDPDYVLPYFAAALQGNMSHNAFSVRAIKLIKEKFPDIELIVDSSIEEEELPKFLSCRCENALRELEAKLTIYANPRMLTQTITTIYLEQYWPLTEGKHQIGGTADIAMVGPDTIFIYDFKSGYSQVQAAYNAQLILYAMGVAKAVGLKPHLKIHLGVLQPYANYDYFQLTGKELQREYDLIVKRLRLDDQALNPGAHCRYCPNKWQCPYITEGLKLLKKPKLSQEDEIKLLTIKPALVRLLDEIERTYVNRLLFGEEVEGIKLVQDEKYGREHYHIEKSD